MQEFKVAADDVGKRTDVFVAEQFPEFSRSALKGLFDSQAVLVNQQPEEPGDKLRAGDKVSINVASLKIQPPAIELPVIYEDKDIVVINKPSGVLSHSKGVLNNEATVASFLQSKITDKNLSGNRAGIVHRLDRPTSGVMVGVKNTEALAKLQKQFSQRKTKKTYLAIVEGIPEPKEALIDAPIARNPKKPQTFQVNANGKPAQTAYKVLKHMKKGSQDYTLLELKPITGRTHQLRVHLKYINYPIVGDRAYGREGDHMYLHASALELTLPNGKRQLFKSPTPDVFESFFHD
jgi:23S rRNA pseudouridine1911/1915/1917 synthase